jgi:phospholipase A1/A2
MKKLFSIILLLFIAISAVAKTYESPLTAYRDNYFIANKDDIKFQFSLQGNLFYPSKTGLFFAYTQVAWWDIYDSSSPFREFNHSPEIFYRFESGNNIFKNYVIPGIDYIQLSPFYHKSNGLDGLDSRSINYFYGEIQISAGDVYNFGLNLRAWNYYGDMRDNPDYSDYRGYVQGEVFFQLKSKNVEYFDQEKIYVRGGGNKYGWLEAGVKIRLLTTRFQPFLYAQVFHGYAEGMINYKEKDTVYRVGLVFE